VKLLTKPKACWKVQGIELVPLDRADECCGFGGTFCVTDEAVSASMGKDKNADLMKQGAQFVISGDMSCLMHLQGIAKRNIDSTAKYTAMYYKLREQVANNEGLIRAQAATFAEQQKQQQTEAQKKAARTTRQLWLLGIAILFLLLIAFIFWRNNRQSRKANALLAHQKQQTELTLAKLKAAQVQLIQSEKMASLGELTAGIAHEIQNRLTSSTISLR
jgi:hypothetical protein